MFLGAALTFIYLTKMCKKYRYNRKNITYIYRWRVMGGRRRYKYGQFVMSVFLIPNKRNSFMEMMSY